MQEKVIKNKLSNVNVENFHPLTSVEEMENAYPTSEKATKTILEGRQNFINVLNGKDSRFIIIVGPCSIHNIDAAKEYAQKLGELSKKVDDKILLFMRTYFEKPRTSLGWKGLINDPHLDDSFCINEGLQIARKLLVEIAEMGVYTATELLDPITSAYLAHLVSWAAIGARTTESQIHREMVSGLSVPVGFKNTTNGDLSPAFNAILSTTSPHRFLGANNRGELSIISTKGNKYAHIVLRGGGGTNYGEESIKKTEELLKDYGFSLKIMVDCSHDNSGKDHKKQTMVARDILQQKQNKNQSIFSIMLESNLKPGNQKLGKNKENLLHGVSITDKCIGWEETERFISEAHQKISNL